jgi:putative protease
MGQLAEKNSPPNLSISLLGTIRSHSVLRFWAGLRKEVRKMADFKVGKITHYYDQIGVAVVELLADLTVGEKIKVSGKTHQFEMTVGSMQIEHEAIQTAKKGQVVGMKVEQPVKEGDEIYRSS